MIRGFLLGSVSALSLSAVLLLGAALTVPTNDGARSGSPSPGLPAVQDRADAMPRVPDRPGGAVTPIEPPPTQVTADPAATGVQVPTGSRFNQPPEDGTAVTPAPEAAPRPSAVSEGLPPGPAAVESPTPRTDSAMPPTPVEIAGFGSGPDAETAPAVPRPPAEPAPVTFEPALPADVDTPVLPNARTMEEGAEPPRGAVDADGAGPTVTGTRIENAGDLPASRGAAGGRVTIVEDPLVVERMPQDPVVAPRAPEMPRRLVLDGARGADEAVSAPTRALDEHAVPFTNPRDLPLMSIVLIDDPTFDVEREALIGLDLPLTIAIDPARSDAARVAGLYRDAGHEVVALADVFPAGATPQDVEVAASAMRRALPQAIGLLDPAGGGVTRDRDTLAALLPILAEAGMGLVAPSGGLDTAASVARRGGVPAVTLYRILDDGGEQAPVIERYLDRATFEAAQNGTAVVLGRATVQTVMAVRAWQAGTGAQRVATAPLSAILNADGASDAREVGGD